MSCKKSRKRSSLLRLHKRPSTKKNKKKEKEEEPKKQAKAKP